MSSQDGVAPRLDYYLEPDLYESTFRDRREDVDFFLSEARACTGPILEFGAGSGRVTIPLARAGAHVCAVDLAPSMIERLSARLQAEPEQVRARVTPVLGDMTRVRLAQKFELVLGTFNVIGHLHTQEELSAFLDTVEAHVTPGGRILFDSMVPSPEELDADPEELFECDPCFDPTSGETVTPLESFAYDPESRLLTVRTRYKTEAGEREGAPLVLRQWFPRELEAILRARNYTSLSLTADYGASTDLSGAEMLVVQIDAPRAPGASPESSHN